MVAHRSDEHATQNVSLGNLGITFSLLNVTFSGTNMSDQKVRLEYLRGEIEAERISYDELVELQSLVDYIEADDVQLLEAAGVEE